MKPNNILLSIHPNWAELIYSGEKQVEWRKSIPMTADENTRVYLYETSPVRKVTGYFMWDCVYICDTYKCDKYTPLVMMGKVPLDELHKYQGIGYQATESCLVAWKVGKVVRFDKPFTLADFNRKRAPQSWCYTDINI